jgi:hypothetical protein
VGLSTIFQSAIPPSESRSRRREHLRAATAPRTERNGCAPHLSLLRHVGWKWPCRAEARVWEQGSPPAYFMLRPASLHSPLRSERRLAVIQTEAQATMHESYASNRMGPCARTSREGPCPHARRGFSALPVSRNGILFRRSRVISKKWTFFIERLVCHTTSSRGLPFGEGLLDIHCTVMYSASP